MKSWGPSSPPDPGLRSLFLPAPSSPYPPSPRTKEDSQPAGGGSRWAGFVFKAGPHRWAGWLDLHLFLIGRAADQREGPLRSACTGRAAADSAEICGVQPEKQNVGTLKVKREYILLRRHTCMLVWSMVFFPHMPSKLTTTKDSSWSTNIIQHHFWPRSYVADFDATPTGYPGRGG